MPTTPAGHPGRSAAPARRSRLGRAPPAMSLWFKSAATLAEKAAAEQQAVEQLRSLLRTPKGQGVAAALVQGESQASVPGALPSAGTRPCPRMRPSVSGPVTRRTRLPLAVPPGGELECEDELTSDLYLRRWLVARWGLAAAAGWSARTRPEQLRARPAAGGGMAAACWLAWRCVSARPGCSPTRGPWSAQACRPDDGALPPHTCRDFKVDVTLDLMASHANWRVRHCPDGFVEDGRVSDFVAMRAMHVQGCDKQGRAMGVLLVRNHLRK